MKFDIILKEISQKYNVGVFEKTLNNILKEQDLVPNNPVSTVPATADVGPTVANTAQPSPELPSSDLNLKIDLIKLAVDALQIDLEKEQEDNSSIRSDVDFISSTKIGPNNIGNVLNVLKKIIFANSEPFEVDSSKLDAGAHTPLIQLIKDLLIMSPKKYNSLKISEFVSNLKQIENLDPIAAEELYKKIYKELTNLTDSSISTLPDISD